MDGPTVISKNAFLTEPSGSYWKTRGLCTSNSRKISFSLQQSRVPESQAYIY